MDKLDINAIMRVFQDVKKVEHTANYYFQTHSCDEYKEEVKIQLEYKIQHENMSNIILFGFCNRCGTLFYHEDFEDKTLL